MAGVEVKHLHAMGERFCANAKQSDLANGRLRYEHVFQNLHWGLELLFKAFLQTRGWTDRQHQLLGLPMLLAGMVGSTIGWTQAPYVELPAGSDTLAASLTWMDPRTAIVPGVVQRDPADVMRGEEVQLLGAAEAGLLPNDALLCQPGTHCKWVEFEQGKIGRFTTSMTGELFKLLHDHSILAAELDGAVLDGPAFRDGVRRGAGHRLQTELFGIRARSVLGERRDHAALASGLLIGDDVARHVAGRDVYILADEALGALYVAAVDELGGQAHRIDSHAAFIAGITRIAEYCA